MKGTDRLRFQVCRIACTQPKCLLKDLDVPDCLRFGHFLRVDSNHDFRLNKNVAAQEKKKTTTTKLWNESNKCFLDLFPKHKIVYLSPESKHPLTSFSHDDIYVIGLVVSDDFKLILSKNCYSGYLREFVGSGKKFYMIKAPSHR